MGPVQSSVASQPEITSRWLSPHLETFLTLQPDVKTASMTSLIIPVTLATLLSSALAANIALQDICGNKLVGSCPDKISLKVVGGDSSCAEKVPWNVLVELVTGPKVKAAGKW